MHNKTVIIVLQLLVKLFPIPRAREIAAAFLSRRKTSTRAAKQSTRNNKKKTESISAKNNQNQFYDLQFARNRFSRLLFISGKYVNVAFKCDVIARRKTNEDMSGKLANPKPRAATRRTWFSWAARRRRVHSFSYSFCRGGKLSLRRKSATNHEKNVTKR